MFKRFTVFLISLLLIISPSIFVDAEADDYAKNPFEKFDIQRQAAIENSLNPGYKSSFQMQSFFSSTSPEGSTYIVRFKEECSLSDIYRIVENYSFTLLANSESRVFSLIINDYDDFVFRFGDKVEYISENRERTASAMTNDPLLPDIWAFDYMDVYNAWDLNTGNRDVVVAVLDTGIERRHEDFSGTNILPGYDTITKKTLVNTDNSGHGTKICGIIAATGNNGKGIAGIGYGVTVMPVRVAGTSDTIYSSNLIMGLYFAADAGAKIINMSFGGYSSSDAEIDAIDYAITKDCVLVASSGNYGGADKLYPACYGGVIGVGSVDRNGKVSGFSQHNDCVDVTAPGEDIVVLKYLDGESDYIYDKGTSLSAAYVSGVAALAVSNLNKSVKFGSEEFLSLIRDTGGKWNEYYGYGIINAKKILDNVNLPIITGVVDGNTYFESVRIRFNRGTAKLDDEVIRSGEVVFENGQHTLEVSDGAYKRIIEFNVDNKPLSYEYKEKNDYAAFYFEGGYATLDGFPYASGQHITNSGEHTFVLSDQYSNSITKEISLSFDLPYVLGVENNKTYNTAVYIRIIGSGSATLNGKKFSGETVVGERGEHTLIVSNKSKSKSKTYKFSINNHAALTFQSDLVNAKAIVDSQNDYIILYSKDINGIRVYDIANPTTNKKYLNLGRVNGYDFYGDYLLLYHDNSISKLHRNRILNQSDPLESVVSFNRAVSGCLLLYDDIYYVIGNRLYRYNLVNKQNTVVSELPFGVNSALLSTDREVIFLIDTNNQGSDILYYDIAQDEVVGASLSVNKHDKKIVTGGGMLAVGNTLIEQYSLWRVREYSSDNPLAIKGSLLFTDSNIINTDTNSIMAFFRDKVNDIFIDDNKVYVFYENGAIDIITAGLDPVENFAPFLFNAAVYEDVITSASIKETEYNSFSYFMSGRKVKSFAAAEDRFYIICENIPVLYIIDANTLLQIEEVPLYFIPKEISIYDTKLYISFMNERFVYSSGVFDAVNGVYLDIGFSPQSLSVSDDKLVTIKNGMISITDLSTWLTESTGISAYKVMAVDGKIYASSGSILNIYDINTFLKTGSISTGVNISSFLISEDYAFIGEHIYELSTNSLLINTGDRINAHRGNTVFTSKGVFDIAKAKYISGFSHTGYYHYLDQSFNYYVITDQKIIKIKSADGVDLTEKPIISGVEADKNYYDGVTPEFSFGIGYINTEKISSGSVFKKGGVHKFTLILSCGIKYEYDFRIIPAVSGIEIIGGNKRINLNETVRLSIKFIPEGSASTEVHFSSLHSDVVSVDEHGRVTGIKEGIAIIRAETADGRFSAECKMIVSKKLITFKPDSDYKIDRDNSVIYNISPGTAEGRLYKNLVENGSFEIINEDGKKTDGLLRTGMLLILKNDKSEILDRLTLSINGDIDGDGFVSAEDYYYIIEVLENPDIFTPAQIIAADLDNNQRISNSDLSALRRMLFEYNADELDEIPPVKSDTSIHAVIKTTVYCDERVLVAIQLDRAKDIYAVSAQLKYDRDLLEFVNFNKQSWEDFIYDGDGIVSFLSYEKNKDSAIKGSKTVLAFLFNIKENAVGKELLFEINNTVAVINGVSYTLANSQTQRMVEERPDSDFKIIINNAEDFVFDKNVFEYDVTVEHMQAFLDIETLHPQNASVIISNPVIPDSGFLEVRVIYVEPDGNSYTYIINVTRKDEYIQDDNCYLANLSVKGCELTPKFKKTTLKYSLIVPFETDKLELVFSTESELCSTEVNNPLLEVGQNSITITCTSESGRQKVYTILVTREEQFRPDNSLPSEPKSNSYIGLYIGLSLLLFVGGLIVYYVRYRKKGS